MSYPRAFLSAFGLMVLFQGGALSSAQAAAPVPKVVAYVPNWIDLNAFSKKIDYSKITHINLAFENPEDEDGELSFNEDDDVLITAAHAQHVPVLISIGGGSASSNKKQRELYADLMSDDNRSQFVAKIVAYVNEHNFDGVDVDLEGPAISDDYGDFIKELAKGLQPQGKLLTAALSQGYGGDQVHTSTLKRFDWVNIMAYDSTGPWEPKEPGQHSSFDYAKSNVDYWLKRGLPRSKAVLGVPFYGYGFGDSFKKGEYQYSDILGSFPGASQLDQVGNTIWYNGIPTIRAKTQYARQQGLAGMMIWSLDGDVQGSDSLLSVLHDGLTQ